MQKQAFTINEACDAIGIGRSRLYGFIAEGKIPVRKAGKRTLILAEDLTAFLRSLPESN